MPYSINFSAKVLPLVMEPLLFKQAPPVNLLCARFVHFTAPLGRRGGLLRGQIYTSGSTFIKKI